MKRCDWCGKEYPDTAEQCEIDGHSLAGCEASSAILPQVVASSTSPALQEVYSLEATSKSETRLTECHLQIFELCLVCFIAFGGSILYSTWTFFGFGSRNSAAGMLKWINSSLHELGGLGLLWYVLFRRSKSFSDLGFSWRKRDVGISILLWITGAAAFSIVYRTIYFIGVIPDSQSAANERVANLLFGSGFSFMTFAFQFLNPFFEELIVRAYVMSEVRQLTNSIFKAVLISTVLQTSYHFYQGAPLAISDGAIFLIFSIYYARTNRITPIILAHIYMDVIPTIQIWFNH